MALISCTECGKEFSDKAMACPNCACPTSVMVEVETPDISNMEVVNGVFIDMASIVRICGYGTYGSNVNIAREIMNRTIIAGRGSLPFDESSEQERSVAINMAYRQFLSEFEPFEINTITDKKGKQIDMGEVLRINATSAKKGIQYIMSKTKFSYDEAADFVDAEQ